MEGVIFLLECGLNKCMCVEDATIQGIEIGKIYQYIHTPEYETNKERKTYGDKIRYLTEKLNTSNKHKAFGEYIFRCFY